MHLAQSKKSFQIPFELLRKGERHILRITVKLQCIFWNKIRLCFLLASQFFFILIYPGRSISICYYKPNRGSVALQFKSSVDAQGTSTISRPSAMPPPPAPVPDDDGAPKKKKSRWN
jgi:hypothetical protein